MRAYTRRENSEDSIEVLSTTDSIFPDDLTAIAEEEAEQHLQSNGLEEEEEEGLSVHGERTPDAADPRNDDDSDHLDAYEPPGPAPANGDVIKGEPVVTRVKSSQVEEDKTTRMSRIWRGSGN